MWKARLSRPDYAAWENGYTRAIRRDTKKRKHFKKSDRLVLRGLKDPLLALS